MMRCPNCGALNPPEADWCNQCLTRFKAPPPPEATAPSTPSEGPPAAESEIASPDPFDSLPTAADASPAATPSLPPSAVGTSRGPFTVTDGGVVWACQSCETLNPLDIEVCRTCGALLRSQLEPKTTGGPQRDPRLTLLVSLAFPGAGHAYAAAWGQAIARASITVMILAAVAAGLTLDAAGARMMSFVFVAAALAMWAVSAHDAVREAEGRSREAILQGRMFLYLVLVLLGLLLVQMFLGASSS